MTKRCVETFICFFLLVSFSCKSQGQQVKPLSAQEYAKEQVRLVKNSITHKLFCDTLIKTKETAIATAEPIVFGIYGKKNIVEQRPYKCYLIDEYWYVSGTLPKNIKGGVFEIILSSKDGKVVSLIHGK